LQPIIPVYLVSSKPLMRPDRNPSFVMDQKTDGSEQRSYPAEKARGGEIILRKPWQRGIFMAGLVGAVVLALLFTILAGRFS
jgi:hypothetical protein